MKTLIISILTLFLVSGCASRTEHGDCIGISDKEDPKLEYKYSTRNIIVGALFFEMLFPPVLVALNQAKCPVGVK